MMANPKTHRQPVQQTRWQGIPSKTQNMRNQSTHSYNTHVQSSLAQEEVEGYQQGIWQPWKIGEPKKTLKGGPTAIWKSGLG